ncbi:MAG TPA: tetratricopeptide repeat protein [Candidatus Hydrogenedentes bacterium]|nr:tetratricopeptide repeat protein [Candidatus Hydrogenedentota bacterium]
MDPNVIIVLVSIAGIIVLALIFHQLKVKVKHGDVEISIDGNKSSKPRADKTPPSDVQATETLINQQGQTVTNETNIGGDQYRVEGNVSPVTGNVIQGDMVIGVKIIYVIQQLPSPPQSLPCVYQIAEPVENFVDREKEIERVLSFFDSVGNGPVIVGIRGREGVGKTEFAKVLASKLKEKFCNGQIIFNLRGTRENRSVNPATAAEALTHVVHSFHPDEKLPENEAELRGIYTFVLQEKKVLLLMDDAWCIDQVAPLIPLPAGCALIVTSRDQFTLEGMIEVDLDLLSPEESQKLLLQICPRINVNAEKIARECGHLPLALKHAASYLNIQTEYSSEEYFNALCSEKERLLSLKTHEIYMHAQTEVEASLAVSYGLLDDPIKQQLRASSVFPSDFEAKAASVCQLKENEATAALDYLCSVSMISRDEKTNRFRLHDLVREYARAQQSEEERTTIERRHAEHYARVLKQAHALYLKGDDSTQQSFKLFIREWENICAGQAWAAAHWETDETAAQLCSEYPDAGTCYIDRHLHPKDRIVWRETAVKAARKLNDRAAEGRHLGSLGVAYADLGDSHKAIEYFEQRLNIAREISDRHGEGTVLGNLGGAYLSLGDSQKAIEYHKQAFIIMHEVGDRQGEGSVLSNLGIAYLNLHKPQKAIEHHERALDIAREIGDRCGEGACLGNLGSAYLDLEYSCEEITYNKQCLEVEHELVDRHGEERDFGSLQSANKHLGQARKAMECFEQYLGIAHKIGDLRGEANALWGLGNTFFNLGAPEKSVEHYKQALTIIQKIGDQLSEGSTYFNLALALDEAGRRNDAIPHAEKAVELCKEIMSPHLAKAQALLKRLKE